MTVIVGGLLGAANQVLAPAQKKALELDNKKAILKSVMKLEASSDVEKIYADRIKSFVVDANGNKVAGKVAEDINIRKQSKAKDADRLYPVYKFLSAADKNKTEAYILPLFGNGLWNNIWGYIALKSDFNTVAGIVFDHAGETPGLGARITEEAIQERYKNRLIFDQNGKLISVKMVKGEGHPEAELGEHMVDGMSGATLTANGVNAMLYTYLDYYLPYIKKNRQ